MIRQSGDKDGLHLKMSNKVNKRLRTILHLMVSSLIKANMEPNAIKTNYQKIAPSKPTQA